MKKSLYDISWKVTEEEYRKDPALSYSTLARFEREGFNNFDKLFDQISTPSLVFGQCVDSIITGGQEEFDDRFMVAEYPNTPDSVIQIIKALYSKMHSEYNNINDIPDDIILDCIKFFKFQPNWRDETKINKVKKEGEDYYNLLFIAGDKTIISTSEYQDVVNSVRALKDSKSTEWYFAPNNPFEEVERFYQLKFKATLEGIDYRCMADEIICNHNTKEIFLIDLKTSSHTEWDFFESFIKWRYKQKM